MIMELMTVHVPHEIYARLEERARQTRHSVEDELVGALAEAIPLDDAPLPTDVADTVTALDTMPDDELWQVANTSHLSSAAAAHLAELNDKRQREGLTAEEQFVADALLRQYEHAMLVRAEAMVRLKDRGVDISNLLKPISG